MNPVSLPTFYQGFIYKYIKEKNNEKERKQPKQT